MSSATQGRGRYRAYTLDPVYGCWLYAGPLNGKGYGPHHEAWLEARGPVPKGMELDHGCRRRRCIRVGDTHLELVTRSENEKRKSFKYRLKQKTCPSGHDLSVLGRFTPEGGRICRVCCGL